MDKGIQCSLLQHTEEAAPQHLYEDVQRIADIILAKTEYRPSVGIICGSGLGVLADTIEDSDTIWYKDIPGFPVSTAPGHHGRLLFGRLAGKIVVCMQGRLHPYEGYPVWKCCLPIRVMKFLNVKTMIITNAAGSLNPDYKIGDIMVIKDHINLPGMAGLHPLRGPNDDRFGERFLAMNLVYDKELRQIAKGVAADLNLSQYLREGCYMMQSGPSFETVGEGRFLRLLGGDVAGMSTSHEVIVAKHCGMRIFGLSLVTNYIATTEETADVHISDCHQILEVARDRSPILQDFICRFVGELQDV